MSTLATSVITQARMTSTRLPGKILREVSGRPLLSYHVDRLRNAGLNVIIATTDRPTDDPVQAWADDHAVPVFRGDEHDVLRRFYDCINHFGVETIVRTTCDCPLIDGQLIATALEQHATRGDWAYTSNCLQRTFPRGFDFEIFSAIALCDAHNNATDPAHREHVTPYINQNISGKIATFEVVRATNASHMRLTVDEQDDYQLIERLISEYNAASLTGDQIIALLEQHPELLAINQHIEQKKV